MGDTALSETMDQRKRAILSAVVERYISTGEPVSSAWVTESADLGVCAATVRHEMAELERMGCLDHPHTSAGRVPTDSGYRLYVETLRSEFEDGAGPRELPQFDRESEIEPALANACRALARLTRYLSLAQPPTWGNERLRHLQLARLDSKRVLAVLVTQSGRVHHALLEFGRLPTAGQLRALAAVINDRMSGGALAAITTAQLEDAVRDLWPKRSFADKALRLLAACIPAGADSPLLVEGGSHLLEAQEFREGAIASQVFSLIEERSYLSGLLARQRSGLSVTIGEEAGHPGMRYCALVSTTFQSPGGGTGCIGVLGPKRMRYRPAMSALLTAARHLGEALAAR
jgi:heat-inducible transcriptional repressor